MKKKNKNKKTSENNLYVFGAVSFLFLALIGLLDHNFWGLNPRGITYISDFFKMLLILLFFIILFVLILNKKKKNIFSDLPLRNIIFFGMFFFLVIFQYLNSFITPEVSLERDQIFTNYIFLICFSFMFCYSLQNINDLVAGSRILLITMIILTFQVFVEFSSSNFIFSGFRPPLTFGNVNYMACFFIALLPLVYVLPFDKAEENFKFLKSKKIIFYFLMSVLATVPLVFSQTRAAWLGYYVSMVFIFIPVFLINLFNLKSVKAVILYFSFIAIAVLLPFVIINLPFPFFEGIMSRIIETVHNPMFEIQDRVVGWTGGLALFKKYPLFGAGTGSVYAASFDYIDKYFRIYTPLNSFSHSHSEYVELLGEGGITGLLIFIGLNGYVIVKLLMISVRKTRSFKLRMYSLAVLTGIVAVLIQQIFSLTLRVTVSMASYFSLLAIALFIISESRDNLSEPGNGKVKMYKRNGIIAFMGFLLLFSLYLFLPLFYSEYLLQKGYTSRFRNDGLAYVNAAVKATPDYFRAWLKKLEFDSQNILYEDKKNEIISKEGLDEIEKSINKIKQIHPLLHNMNELYSKLYINKFRYYVRQSDEVSRIIAHDNLEKAYESLNKSLEHDFLLKTTHVNRLFLAMVLKKNGEIEKLVEDYLASSIYLKFCTENSVFRENVHISFVELKGKQYERIYDGRMYNFFISNDFVNSLSEAIKSMPDPDEKYMKDSILVNADSVVDKLCNQ